MKIRTLAVAAVVTLLPAAAFAQAAPAAPEAPAMTTPAPGAELSTDFDMFLQGLGGADFTSAQTSIDTATTFNVVKISTLANADATALQGAITPHEADIAALGGKIEANANATAALEAAGVTAANVVWIETGADGAVTLYVNDLQAM